MFYDFTQPITNMNGEVLSETDKPVSEGGIPATFGSTCVTALIRTYPGDETVSGKVKVERFMLAQKINGAKLPVKITNEDVVMIKELCAKGYGTLVYGRIAELFDKPCPEQKAAA